MPLAHPSTNLLPVFNALPGATLLLSPDWVIVAASDDYLAATLAEREAIIGEFIFDAFPDNPLTPEANAVANVRASLEQVLATRQPHDMAPQHYDVPDRAHPGRFVERHWLPRHTPVLDAAGEVEYIIQSVQDITASRVAAQRLRESRASEQAAHAEAAYHRHELQHFLEVAPVAVALYQGPEHRVEFANATTLAIWGRTREAVLHRPVFEVMPEAATPEVLAIFERVFTLGQPHLASEQASIIFRHGRQETVYWNMVFEPQRGPDGRVKGIFTVGTEVTEQVRARQQVEQLNQALETRVQARTAELRESEARFRIMADAAPNQVWAVHPDGSIRYTNRAFLDFVGLETEQQYSATGWGPYLHPDERELAQATLVEAIAQRRPYVLEHRMRRYDGQYRWLLAQGAPSFLAGGELYGYVGSAIDITELKLANEQLRRTNADLDNFIYTASHDLKAPIANIEGLLTLLREELPPAVAAHETIGPTLVRMLDSVERFKRTLDHLTAVSKLQKEHAPSLSAVDLAAVVEDVRLDLAPLLRETNAELRVHLDGLPAVAFAEKNLRSIVYNLLSNALKYHHPDRRPHVDVRGHQRVGFTVLEVHDNGLGIAAHQLPKLFTMFQRFHDHVEGSGVGLYMVKRMVENAGGRVEVHSQLGAGTTFFVHLPLAESNQG
ncbi:PAS domain-containing sensor histidine kinase [Hymenobacter properus]|uniref:histidine kinase n=1 Tax=Hymenobacter properus TaxID=2791026 RepID=A0A931BEP1_9BACT|nr:PAS domain-containing protein [Hymenobacter properus]MBF9140912.1 PAS domain-containing protein [Hymenobacter properus]MBR7719721.1 PAS domain-containing protein [Microvirga sp. SRT04]